VLAQRKEKRETETIRFANEKKALELKKHGGEPEQTKAEEKASPKPERAR
jgi:hypothetical protein